MQWLFLLFLSIAILARAGPIPFRRNTSILQRPPTSTPYQIENTVVFDAPAFPDPSGSGEAYANFQTFVYGHLKVTSAVERTLNWLGRLLAQPDAFQVIVRRVKLVVATPLMQVATPVNVVECSGSPHVGPTDPNGIAFQTLSFGTCPSAAHNASTTYTIENSQARVFYSPNSGYGVISDIDDTIKVSNVLNPLALVKATFYDEPQAVPGMPALYAKLGMTLYNPQFIYLSASPFHLYPILRGFINERFHHTPGPIFLQNLTFSSIQQLRSFVTSQGAPEYKLNTIRRIHDWYPKKSFYLIGDSGQKDPEAYGEAFRRWGPNFVRCIWIRRIEGSKENTSRRFAKAFRGVPSNRWKVFTDAEINRLASVAAGNCDI